jgi:hypothetical protein
MRISQDGSFYQISIITGPTHNLLRIQFVRAGVPASPTIEVLPSTGECHHAPLDSGKILREVLEGVERANTERGTNFAVAKVQWVENDTPPESTYSFLARRLVEHLAEEGLP